MVSHVRYTSHVKQNKMAVKIKDSCEYKKKQIPKKKDSLKAFSVPNCGQPSPYSSVAPLVSYGKTAKR